MTGPFKPTDFESIGPKVYRGEVFEELAAATANAIYAKWGTCEKGGEHDALAAVGVLHRSTITVVCTKCQKHLRARWEAV